MRSAPCSANAARRRVDVHVALERVVAVQSASFGAGQVERRRRRENSTLARVVSKWLLFGTTSPSLAHHREEDPLGGAALVRRDDVLEADQVARPSRSKRKKLGRRRSDSSPRMIPPTGRRSWRRCRCRSAGR